MMTGFSEAKKEWSRSITSCIHLIWGGAVLPCIAASVALLMLKRHSRRLFDSSLETVQIQMTYTMIIAVGIQVMGPQAAIMPIISFVLQHFHPGLLVMQTTEVGWALSPCIP